MNMKWTNADAKRAEKMGWWLEVWTPRASDGEPFTYYRVQPIQESPFKSDSEAAEWVLESSRPSWAVDESADNKTCRKAVLICMTGGGK